MTTRTDEQLSFVQEQLGFDDAAFEVFTDPCWPDGYCYTDMLELHRRAIEALQARLPVLVIHAQRRDDASWADIGQALGISRQAAQQRYGR